jgi:hypothetical protein
LSEQPDIILLPAREGPLKGVGFIATRPPDCLPHRWTAAVPGFRRFIVGSWADRALECGWTAAELFGSPGKWSQIHLTGCAWLVGDRKVIGVETTAITIETPEVTYVEKIGTATTMKTRPGSQLRFRRRPANGSMRTYFEPEPASPDGKFLR